MPTSDAPNQGSRLPPVPPPTKLVVGDVHHPLIEIERYQPDRIESFDELPLALEHKMALGALLQHAPALALSTAATVTNTYVLRFAPAVSAQLATGSLTLMHSLEGGVRAVAVNSSGKIVAHGTLVSTAALNPAAAALAAWQVMAMVTAQHYLHDLQQRLARIETGIADIKQWLEAHDIATLASNLRYIQSVGDLFQGRLVSEADMPVLRRKVEQLETIDRECGRVFTAFQMATRQAYDTFRTMRLGDTFTWNVEQNSTAALHTIADYERYARASLMAIVVRAAGAELRSTLPLSQGDRESGLHLLRTLQNDLRDWRQTLAGFCRPGTTAGW